MGIAPAQCVPLIFERGTRHRGVLIMLKAFLFVLLFSLVGMIVFLLVLLQKAEDVERRINSGEVPHWKDQGKGQRH